MKHVKLAYKDGTSDKFWEIRVEGSAHTVTFGRSGTGGQTKTKRFGSPADAVKDADKLVAEKTKKGYKPASTGRVTATQPARAPTKTARPPRVVTTVGKVVVPELLQAFQGFYAEQPEDSLAIEGLSFEEIYAGYDPEITPKLRKDGFVFFELGEGSMIVVLQVDGQMPVVLLNSDGGERLLASSLEDFLVRWSKGDTGISELDGTDEFPGISAAGRKALAGWLKEHKVTVPKKSDFDLALYLSGANGAAVAAPVAPAAKPIEGLPASFVAIVDVVGRRADDPVVVNLVATIWKKRVPASTTDYEADEYLTAPKKSGAEGIGFTHEIWHDRYPPIAKTARAYIPYVSSIGLSHDWPEKDLPFGLTWKADAAALTRALGAGRVSRSCLGDDESETTWTRVVDPARGIELHASLRKRGVALEVAVTESVDLVSPVLVPGDREELGLFVAWAITRGLLDESRFAGYEELLAAIKKRKANGTEFVDAALARGLWWDHFRDLSGEAFGLRDRLWHYFADEPTLTGDLCALFGKRKDKNGHSKPTLPKDGWSAVDLASKILDKRFATWVRS